MPYWRQLIIAYASSDGSVEFVLEHVYTSSDGSDETGSEQQLDIQTVSGLCLQS